MIIIINFTFLNINIYKLIYMKKIILIIVLTFNFLSIFAQDTLNKSYFIFIEFYNKSNTKIIKKEECFVYFIENTDSIRLINDSTYTFSRPIKDNKLYIKLEKFEVTLNIDNILNRGLNESDTIKIKISFTPEKTKYYMLSYLSADLEIVYSNNLEKNNSISNIEINHIDFMPYFGINKNIIELYKKIE